MKLHAPLQAITPTLDGDVLTVLARARDWFTIARLQELIGNRSREGIRRTLARLVSEGTVLRLPAGREVLYSLNREHLAAPSIIALAHLRETFIKRLSDEMAQWKPSPLFAALFGSAARGKQHSASDVDLFVLRPEGASGGWDQNVHELSERASQWVGSDVRPFILSAAEVPDEEPVIGSISREGIPIIGDSSRFRRLANTT